jgi:hypothetical protein
VKHDASKTLDEGPKKQCDSPIALQARYKEHKEQPLSEMSHIHRDFFGFVAPPSYERTQAYTNKDCYNYVKRDHLSHQCPLALNCLRNPTLVEISKMTLEEESPCNP